MKNRFRKVGGAILFVSIAGSVIGIALAQQTPNTSAKGKPAVAAKTDYAYRQAKRELNMLDDIYKTSIVLITTHYVDGKDSLPAGRAFKKLFAAMGEKKWHEVRLLDGTGDPYEPNNAPKTEFEKKAMQAILDGAPQHEQVVTENGSRYLLAATAVPVVMEKCTLCHDSYKNVPAGKAIGAIGYKIPLQEIE